MDTSLKPGISTIPAIEVNGVLVRTSNHIEMSDGKGRIASLWNQFDQQIAPQLKQGSRVFGVYSDYESDLNGHFNVLAGTDQKGIEVESGSDSRLIQAGRYLVFPVRGELPLSVVVAWQAVWDYFQQDDCPYQRAYTTDFELYTAKDSAELHIAVR